MDNCLMYTFIFDQCPYKNMYPLKLVLAPKDLYELTRHDTLYTTCIKILSEYIYAVDAFLLYLCRFDLLGHVIYWTGDSVGEFGKT